MSNKNLFLLIVCLLLAGIVAVNLLDEQQTAVPQRSDPGASRSIQTVAAVTRLHAGTTSHRSLHFAATRTLHAASIRSGIGSFHSVLPPAVDPPLFFSTYLSGRGAESGVTLAFDAEGNIYVAGTTTSSDFPTLDPLHPFLGGMTLQNDVYVAKFSADGSELLYATYLGGSGDESVSDLVVDPEGHAYVAGATTSHDFPTQGSLHTHQGGSKLGSDAFIARLTPDGTALSVSTFFGGRGDDSIDALALDEEGVLYAAGSTNSADLPTTANIVQADYAGGALLDADVFVARFQPTPTGLELAYATYLGGRFDEVPSGLAVDAEGFAWVTGFTNSDDFPLHNPLQDTFRGPLRDLEGDVFVARLAPDATTLDFSTYLGGRRNDQSRDLALDSQGDVWLTGWTDSPDFPMTAQAMQPARSGAEDAFLSQLTHAGSEWRLDYSTFFGQAGYDQGLGLAVDETDDHVWITGVTTDPTLPTVNPIQPTYGGGPADAFAAQLDLGDQALVFSTLLGGSAFDQGAHVAIGPTGLTCMTGTTTSPDFPAGESTEDPEAPSHAFLTCFGTRALTQLSISPDSVSLVRGTTQQFMANGTDQFGQPFAVEPTWTTTGGSIDAAGFFTAGDEVGTFTVTASAPASGLDAQAVVHIVSGVPTEDEATLPDAFALYQNYPNPFNPETVISFEVQARTRVVLGVFDLLGQRTATLVDAEHPPGRYEVRFTATGWPSGTYFYRIRMGGFTQTKTMVLLR